MNSRYVANRVGQALFTLWVVVTISFGLIQALPGGPKAFLGAVAASSGGGSSASAASYMPADPIIDPANPIHVQYVNYLSSIARGDFGESLFFGVPVATVMQDALPWTIFLYSIIITTTFVVGVTAGVFLAYRQGSRFDEVVSSVATMVDSIPYYVAGVVLVFVLGALLDVFPTSGRYAHHVTPGFNLAFIGSVLYHAALPIASVVLTAWGFVALAMRGNSIRLLGSDFVRVAKLRGLEENRIAYQYIGRNGILPMYTGLMIAIGSMFAGSVVLEFIFQYEGAGYYLLYALEARDYPLLMAGFIIITSGVVIGLFIADLTYGLIDPRAAARIGEADRNSTWLLNATVRAGRRLWLALTWPVRRGDASTGGADAEAEDRSTTPYTFPMAGGEPPASPPQRAAAPTTPAESIFETTAGSTVSRRDWVRRMADDWIIAPATVMWNDRRTRLGAAILLVYVLIATIGVMLVPEPHTNQGPRMIGAFQDMAHPLGTTVTGQGILALVVHSTPPMLIMILSGAVFTTTMATCIGLLSGYLGGVVDRGLMTLSDIAMTIPGLPLIMVLALVFEPTNPVLIGILITVNAWGGIARQIRSQVLTIREELYVEASSVMALPLRTILTKDLLPNLLPFISVQFVLAGRGVIIGSVALYFLGVLPFETLNWGVILNLGYQNGALYTIDGAHWMLSPVVAIVLLTYGFLLFSQGMESVFNPRVRARMADDETAAPVADERTRSPTGTGMRGD